MAGLSVNAVVLKQNGTDLYLFPMNSANLRKICYVTPRSSTSPQEIQRLISEKRARQIGEYIQEATALLPNSIVISLETAVNISSTGDPSIKVITFPEAEGKFGYILDGQHRLEGFKYSEGKEFDLPVVALYDAPEARRVKVFADINSKQVPVSKVQLAALYYQIKALDPEDVATMDVVLHLNNDPDSPLQGKVMTIDDQKGTWIKNVALAKLIAPHVTSGGALARLDIASRSHVLKQYLQGVKQTWSVEWDDREGFNVSHPIGLELLLRMLPRAMFRVRLHAGHAYTADNFAIELTALRDVELELAGFGEMRLDWVRGTMGFFASAAARKTLGDAMLDALNEE